MKQGFILFLVLAMISILTIGVVSYNYWIRTKSVFANNAVFDLKTSYLAKAGINYAFFLLQNDQEPSDNLNEDWARIEPFTLGGGKVRVKITDESGKININRFKENRTILCRLFDVLELESGKIDAIADWIDADNIPLPDGAENEYYISLKHPYSCKNAPLDTIGELIMIKGMDRKILDDEEKGLINFLTMTSGNEININTAPSKVLEAILNNRALSERIISQREEKPFTNKTEIKDFLEPTKTDLFTCESNVFSLESTGIIPPHYQKKIKAIIQKNPLKILYYKVE